MIKNYNLILYTSKQSLEITIPDDLSVRLALDIAGICACGEIGTCEACTIQTISGDFSPPTLAEWQKIPEQEREKNSHLGCQLYYQSNAEVFLETPAPKSNWKFLDLSGWPDYHYPLQNRDKTIDAPAVDLGTTHIRLSLCDRYQQNPVASRHGNNPQASFGEDVLTGLDVQRQRSQELESLMQMICTAIIEGVRDILQRDMVEVKSILAKGLLSIMDCAHIELFGNAALSGGEKVLLNPEYEQLNKKLRDALQAVNVLYHREYEDLSINYA
mgnify:FL=1